MKAIRKWVSRVRRRLAVPRPPSRAKKRAYWDSIWVNTPQAPSFLRRTDPHSFEVVLTRGFRFYDRFKDKLPCMVLQDAKGYPRFVLGFSFTPRGPVIRYVQRTPHTFLRRAGAFFSFGTSGDLARVNALETRDSKKFQADLHCHPAEFLVSSFLWWCLKTNRWIPEKNRVSVFLNTEMAVEQTAKYVNSRAWMDRFFRKAHQSGEGSIRYDVQLTKRRVRELVAAR